MNSKHLCVVCSLGLLLLAGQAWAQSPEDLDLLFDAPCARYGAPKALARAIAHHESGLRPWAMNIEGRPILHASKEQALAVARAALQAGLSFDVGVMQINSWWIRRYHLPLEVVFEPRGNVQVGVWILAQSIKRFGLTWQAVATYHTPNPERGRAYAAAVLARLSGRPVAASAAPSMAAESSAASKSKSSPAASASPLLVKRFRQLASNETELVK
uniref:Soluble lytic murein transglycosylase-like protein n=1 Tax=Desulfovibrio sp. U5L TaxID=596152 RepID=I2PX39_9BACT